MKTTLILLVVMAGMCFGASVPAREAQSIGCHLAGDYQSAPYYGIGFDIIVTTKDGHAGGGGGGFFLFYKDTAGEVIRQSGMGMSVGAAQSIVWDGGRNPWPQEGKILNFKREVNSCLKTNKDGETLTYLFMGATKAADAHPLCVPLTKINCRVTADVVAPAAYLTPFKIKEWFCSEVSPATCPGCSRGFYGDSSAGTGGFSIGMTSQPLMGIVEYEEVTESDLIEPNDPPRVHPTELEWPGDGFHKVFLDNTFVTTEGDHGLNVIYPEGDISEFISNTEAWVYCASGVQGPAVATCWMRGQSVRMYGTAQGYISEYLFVVTDSNFAGRVGGGTIPATILCVLGGQSIEVENSEPNIPDVISHWLEPNSKSCLIGEEHVDFRTLAVAIKYQGCYPSFLEPKD
jgi:hypothetical protein